jgi:hypothetical protein
MVRRVLQESKEQSGGETVVGKLLVAAPRISLAALDLLAHACTLVRLVSVSALRYV